MIHVSSAVQQQNVVSANFGEYDRGLIYLAARKLLLKAMDAKLGNLTPGESRELGILRKWVSMRATYRLDGGRGKKEPGAAYFYINLNTGSSLVIIERLDIESVSVEPLDVWSVKPSKHTNRSAFKEGQVLPNWEVIPYSFDSLNWGIPK